MGKSKAESRKLKAEIKRQKAKAQSRNSRFRVVVLSQFQLSAFNFPLFLQSAFNFQLLSSRLSNVWKQREASDLIPCGASSRRGGLPFLIPVFTRNPTSRLQFAIRLALSGFSALLRFTHEQVSTLPSFSGSSTPLGQGRGRISPHER